MTRSIRGLGLLGLSLALSAGCAFVPFGGKPIVLPTAARLGDTAALSVDSNYIPFADGAEKHNLTRDNTTLEIRDGATVLATIDDDGNDANGEIVAVFDGYAADSRANRSKPGWMLTAVIFNLPTSLNGNPPLPINTKVHLMVDGMDDPLADGDLTILDTGGSPIQFLSESDPLDLEPAPMLRLRGVKDTNSGTDPVLGFRSVWNIAGVEFTLEFPPSKVTNPEAFVASQARHATVLVGPETTPGTVLVTLLDPKGFKLPDLGNVVGDGPFIDIVFDKVPGQGFDETDFTIRGLKVFNRMGDEKVEMGPTDDATSFFEFTVRANLP